MSLLIFKFAAKNNTMNIAFASDGENRIAAHFGQARGFEIIEVIDGRVGNRRFLENTFTGHARGMHSPGGGHHHEHEHGHAHNKHEGFLAALKDCSVVISNGMGQGAYQHLRNAGKEVYITSETEISTALELYLEGKLEDEPLRGCKH
jgi:predicted Fe-Mo cluster-binding NifX family protein